MFAWGNPLCESTSEKRKETADEFVGWGKEKGWKVIWCCVDSEFEKVLAEGVAGVRWSTLSCREEDVLHPNRVKFKNRDVKQNLRRAERANLSCEELRLWEPDYLPEDTIKKSIDSGLDGWRKSKQGKQIALASLDAWLDASNRRYFIARTPHEIVGICILTPIAGASYQIINAIRFPNAPRGTSEALLIHVIKEMKSEGRQSLTFGPSATEKLLFEHNIRRGSKFEAEQNELLHISFPPHGFGLGGLIALMRMLKVK